MSNNSFVLQALKILGPKEILKLSEVLHGKPVVLKQAAGAEFIVWDDDAGPQALMDKPSKQNLEAKVLPFPKSTVNELVPLEEEMPKVEEDEEPLNLLNSEVVLWQREVAKAAGGNCKKLNAFKGYKKSTEMYVVKTPDVDGKDKIRFAETNGILVNKKQA